MRQSATGSKTPRHWVIFAAFDAYFNLTLTTKTQSSQSQILSDVTRERATAYIMTDTTASTAGADESKADEKPKGPNKLILIGAALAVLGSAAGGYFFFLASKPPEAEQHKDEKKVTSFLEMKEMLIGMAPDNAQPAIGPQRFMKLKVTLEIADAKKVPAIQTMQPRIEDLFQVYLRELHPSDLQGSAAIFRLKDELLRRVNIAVNPERVEAVLIKELLLQ